MQLHGVGRSLLITILFCLSVPEAEGQRDPCRWPFARTSIWNMPLHRDARYKHARIEPPEVGAALLADEDYILMAPDAPMIPIYVNYTRWQHYGNRCEREGHLLFKAPVPEDFVVSPDNWLGETPNGGIAFLMPDGVTIRQTQPFARCEAGGYATSRYVWERQSLYGKGIYGAHGGSSLSAIGGTIRLGELVPGGRIRHALKIIVYGAEFLFYDDETRGWRWPARVSDGYASSTYGSLGNPVKDVRMGSLLALPQDLELGSMGFETGEDGPAMILARALQSYGAYIIDDPYAEAVMFATEWSPEGRVTDEFEAEWGYSFETGTDTPWGRDVSKIVGNLHVITNNASGTIGGGPTGDLENRLARPACDFGAPGSGLMCPGPGVEIRRPSADTAYITPSAIGFNVEVLEDSTAVTKVEYFNDFFYIGETTRPPFDFTWKRPPVGRHRIRAKAVSSDSLHGFSRALTIDVHASHPPRIAITDPEPGEVLGENSDATFRFDLSDPDGQIAMVELYVEDSLVGIAVEKPFEIGWKPPAPGQYTVRAVAADDTDTRTTTRDMRLVVGDCSTGENLIRNGTFEKEGLFWTTWVAFGNNLDLFADSALAEGNRAMKAEIHKASGNPDGIRLYTRLPFEGNREYRICFQARSEHEKKVLMLVKEGGIHGGIRWQKELNLTDTLSFFGPFLFELDSDIPQGEFGFYIGDDGNDLWLDDIRLTGGGPGTFGTGEIIATGGMVPVYPNPVEIDGQIYPGLQTDRPFRVLIFDIRGSLVYRRGNHPAGEPIPVAGFTDSGGTYFLTIHTEQAVFVGKILVTGHSGE